MRPPIWLKFGTLKGLITADLSTTFGRNPMNIHGVVTNYLRKIRSMKTNSFFIHKNQSRNCGFCVISRWSLS